MGSEEGRERCRQQMEGREERGEATRRGGGGSGGETEGSKEDRRVTRAFPFPSPPPSPTHPSRVLITRTRGGKGQDRGRTDLFFHEVRLLLQSKRILRTTSRFYSKTVQCRLNYCQKEIG